jgi:hypothetical protein
LLDQVEVWSGITYMAQSAGSVLLEGQVEPVAEGHLKLDKLKVKFLTFSLAGSRKLDFETS